ncbi:Circadian clock protein kaiC-like protein [Pseudomonas savastanoi]|uniref:Circadian clock protein kaiC-like protein n=1 Tax=Pseudomonas savastanoi TaxID=29438 RepID=A0A3M5GJT5_PSESS|nr:Circadian clock protein kaiC-like protein [Pseudomonas savastanoi]
MKIVKYRGQKYRGGFHDFTIAENGIHVFPRLVAAEHRSNYARTQVSSGITELDDLLGGGIESGSSTLILGPAGTGKSLISLVFAAQAVARGERVGLFIFDEEMGLLFERISWRICAPRKARSGPQADKDRDHRQHQWLSGGNAGRERTGFAHARASALPQSPGRIDLHDRCTTRAGR